MLLEVGTNQAAVLGPAVERIRRAVNPDDTATPLHKGEQRGSLLGCEVELAARQREHEHLVLRERCGVDAAQILGHRHRERPGTGT